MKVDLSIGHPVFMQEAWRNTNIPATIFQPWEYMDYEKEGGLWRLKNVIRSLHKTFKNAVHHDKKIVISNGATQMLMAAAYAMHKRTGCWFLIKPPYWYRLKTMLESADYKVMIANISIYSGPTCEIVVTPNNPDNSYRKASCQKGEGGATTPIYDLCYNWPQYGDVIEHDEDLMIFSMAKGTGHAGSRIGWALVKDPEVARDMAWYIEMTTGGVSIEAQVRACKLLAHAAVDPLTILMGKQTLTNRWQRFLGSCPTSIVPMNASGMFAWCDSFVKKDPIAWWEELGVKVMPGDKCGGCKAQFRINMGASDEDFENFLLALKRF